MAEKYCLQYAAEFIAAGAIVATAQLRRFSLPGPDGLGWLDSQPPPLKDVNKERLKRK